MLKSPAFLPKIVTLTEMCITPAQEFQKPPLSKVWIEPVLDRTMSSANGVIFWCTSSYCFLDKLLPTSVEVMQLWNH